MAHKLIYIPNYVTRNYPFCRLILKIESLDTQLNEPTDQNSIKVSKVVKPTKQKLIIKLWGLCNKQWIGGIVILASCVYTSKLQLPSNNISINSRDLKG